MLVVAHPEPHQIDHSERLVAITCHAAATDLILGSTLSTVHVWLADAENHTYAHIPCSAGQWPGYRPRMPHHSARLLLHEHSQAKGQLSWMGPSPGT